MLAERNPDWVFVLAPMKQQDRQDNYDDKNEMDNKAHCCYIWCGGS